MLCCHCGVAPATKFWHEGNVIRPVCAGAFCMGVAMGRALRPGNKGPKKLKVKR